MLFVFKAYKKGENEMVKKVLSVLVCLLIVHSCAFSVIAHRGRTDANGGHWNRKTGEYHYHNGGRASSSSSGRSNYSSSSSSSSSNSSKTSSSQPKKVVASKVKVTNMPANIFSGENCQLKATVEPSDAADKTVSWKSSDTSVATVDSNGKVTALKVGKTTITATTSNGVTAKYDLNVQEVAVKSVTIDNKVSEMHIGETAQLFATVIPENATDKSLKWESEDEDIVSVDENGELKALAIGKTTISVKHKELIDKFEVEVKPIEAESVKIKIYDNLGNEVVDKYRFKIGNEVALEAIILPENTTNTDIKWTLSDSEIAQITESNNFVGLKSGVVTLTATTSNGVTDSVEIEVYGSSTFNNIFFGIIGIGGLVAIIIFGIKFKKKQTESL